MQFNEERSITVRHVIPQGSVAGPILFDFEYNVCILEK